MRPSSLSSIGIDGVCTISSNQTECNPTFAVMFRFWDYRMFDIVRGDALSLTLSVWYLRLTKFA